MFLVNNVLFCRKKNVLDPAYYDFLATLMHPAAGSETLNAAQLQLATRYRDMAYVKLCRMV